MSSLESRGPDQAGTKTWWYSKPMGVVFEYKRERKGLWLEFTFSSISIAISSSLSCLLSTYFLSIAKLQIINQFNYIWKKNTLLFIVAAIPLQFYFTSHLPPQLRFFLQLCGLIFHIFSTFSLISYHPTNNSNSTLSHTRMHQDTLLIHILDAGYKERVLKTEWRGVRWYIDMI